MVDTDFVPRDRFRDRIATGYVVRDGEIDAETPAREHEGRGYKVPNGALYSTVADLARFLFFQLGHGPESLLPHEDLAANFDRLNSADGSLTTGYAASVSRRDGAARSSSTDTADPSPVIAPERTSIVKAESVSSCCAT